MSSSEEEDSPGQPLVLRTVKGYVNAIAELHRWQVSDGSNSWTVFRGPALKGLITDLARTQVEKDRESFADVAAGGISAGYSSEEFLQMSQQLLSGAAVKIQVSLLYFALYYRSMLTYIPTTHSASEPASMCFLGTSSSFVVRAAEWLSSLSCPASAGQTQRARLPAGRLSCRAERARQTRQGIGSIWVL